MNVTVKVHLPKRMTGIGEEALKVQIPDGSSLEDLYRLLGARYPLFAKQFLSLSAKNQKVPLFALINKKGSGLSGELREEDTVEVFLMAVGG
ncbi:MAG: MoaD/ThiS family protein [Spirochaetes bacterium]|nr:MoaD/ThiS family protein [Spirochaetota bacterium]